jgi:transposase
MEKFRLTAKQEIELRVAHRSIREKRYAYRINAVILLGTGWSYGEVSKALLLDDETLRNYVRRYKEEGIIGLTTDDYKGSFCKLSETELLALDAHLRVNTYLTVEAVIDYVAKHYTVCYSMSGMTQLLHRLNFTYKKSKLVPAKADAEKQKQFLKELEILRENKNENDPVLYMDGVHPQHNTMLAYGWIKKGENNIIKSNTGRQRININGALDSDTLQVIVRDDERINALSTIELLKKIELAYPLAVNIFTICDNARYYRSKLVQEFLLTSKIKLVFLPSYSPNLNLIERLWKFMKKKILYNKYYEKFEDFKKATLGFFDNIEQFKDELNTLLTQNFNILDAQST